MDCNLKNQYINTMLIKDIFRKIKYDINCDRIGPDVPFTHWRLYFKNKMLKLCKSKFYNFSEGAEIRPGAYIVGCSKIDLGKNVIIRPGCRFFAESNTHTVTITIEDNVMLGSLVSIYINNHRYDKSDTDIIKQGHYPTEPVIIKSGSWIGANCIILPGVTIGKNSVIGAGSVVTNSIPEGVVAFGNPARIVQKIR